MKKIMVFVVCHRCTHEHRVSPSLALASISPMRSLSLLPLSSIVLGNMIYQNMFHISYCSKIHILYSQVYVLQYRKLTYNISSLSNLKDFFILYTLKLNERFIEITTAYQNEMPILQVRLPPGKRKR